MPNTFEEAVKELEAKEKELEEEKVKLETVKGETQEYETKKQALESETKRILDELVIARKQKEEAKQKDVSFQEKFKEEQKQKALLKFFEEFKYESEDSKKILLSTYQKIDSGSVDSENIYRDLVKSHLIANSDKYIGLEKKINQISGSAEEFLKSSASSGFSGSASGIREDSVDMTRDDVEAAKFSGLPIETYMDLKKRGKI
jgi:uncharacterized protein (DUF3084 family)